MEITLFTADPNTELCELGLGEGLNVIENNANAFVSDTK
jgi:hypothetical protein